MSIQDQINRITNEVGTQTDLIDQIKEALQNKSLPSSGGGIIDVTELPTENIDENAVYRVTGEVLTEKLKIFICTEDGGKPEPAERIVAKMGVSLHTYLVDDLSDMIPSDITSGIHCYVLKSNGIGYCYVPDYGMTLPIGYIFFGAENFDKGKVEITDILYHQELEAGIYTTFSFGEMTKYFIYKDESWEEISCNKSSGDLIQESLVTVLDEEYFKLSSGEYVTSIGTMKFVAQPYLAVANLPDSIETLCEGAFYDCSYLSIVNLGSELRYIGGLSFYNSDILKITIPNKVETIGDFAFGNTALEEVTFKGKPTSIATNCFYGSKDLLTIRMPWSEGEVEGVPWGATNVENLVYNYTGE